MSSKKFKSKREGAGVLTPLKKLTQYPLKKVFAFDVETHGEYNDFVLGSVTDGVKFWRFNNSKDMLNFLISRETMDSMMYATNLQFDFLALLQQNRKEMTSKFNILFHKGRLITVRYPIKKPRNDKLNKKSYNNGKNSWNFYDTMNYIPYSVKMLGKIVNCPKLEHPYFFPKKPLNKKEFNLLQDYCDRDALITQKFAEFLIKGWFQLGGKLKTTIASSSMDLFRREYLKVPLYRPPLDQLMKQYKGYYGGRTEVFQRGTIKNYNYYDVNSLYPSVMMESFPDPNYVEIRKENNKDLLEYEGASECTVVTNDDYYPILPLKHGGKLKFMNGKFKSWFTHVELRKAMDMGYNVKKIHQSVFSKKNIYPFKDYVTDLYDKRVIAKKNNDPMQLLYKLGMNSLYGKFAQKIEEETRIIHEDNMTPKLLLSLKQYDRIGEFFYTTHKINTKRIGRFIIPILSSQVTGKARVKIYEYLNKYGAVYMDTDSLITKKYIPESSKLGEMKLEGKIREGIIVKPKMYMIDAKVTLKGVNNRTPQTFNDILEGEAVNCDRFSKFKESNRRKLKWNTNIKMMKLLGLEDDKRSWIGKFNYTDLQDSKPIIL